MNSHKPPFAIIAVLALSASLVAQAGPPPQQPAAAGQQSSSSSPAPEAVPQGRLDTSDYGTPVATRKVPKPGALPEKNVEDPSDTSDLIPLPPLLPTAATLIGGFVKDIDPVNDRITVAPFGTKRKMKIFFDERSKVYRNGREVDPAAIRKGDRIYLDTQLDKANSRIFARNVRVQTKPLQADAHGQIISYDRQNSIIAVRDDLSGEDVKFHVLPAATVDNQGRPGALTDVQPGALITARFLSGQEGRNEVNRITIIAAPGSDYTFQGRITHLDMPRHVMALENQSDGKIYDIQFDPQRTPIANLQVGAPVNVAATFDGNKYSADTVTALTADELGDTALGDQDQAQDGLTSDKSGKKDKKAKKRKSESRVDPKEGNPTESDTPK